MLNKEGKRMLAYVAKIEEIKPIENADRIEVARVGGWQVVVAKNENFKEGDLVVYIEIDSKVPNDNPYFAFLKDRKYKVKTIKLRKQVSQGLILPLSILPNGWSVEVQEGDDLTEILGIKKIEDEKPIYNRSNEDKLKNSHPNLIKRKWFRALMKYSWFRKIAFKLLIKKSKNREKSFPTQFNGVSKTDQERCLVGDTKIYTKDGILRIADIVNKKIDTEVLSYNIEKDKLEYKKILDYQKYPPNKKEVKLSIEYPYSPGCTRVNHLVCTPDHKCYTQRGYVEAKDLCLSDKLYMFQDGTYSGDNILSVLYGMLLGDGSIAQDKRIKGKVHFQTCHGIKQKKYLEFISNMFKNDGKIISNGIGKFGVKEKPVYKLYLNVDSYIDENIKKDWLKDGKKKKVTAEVINKLTAASLAFWYMDDGNLSYRNFKDSYGNFHNPSIRLNTQSFSEEEIDLLMEMLVNKFGIECKKREDKGFIIYITTKGTKKFLELVTPYMCKDMAYKTTSALEDKLETKCFSFEKEKRLIEVPILSINPTKVKKYQNSSTYDLEIEDNHNFIAQNILTHNCENMAWILKDKSSFIVTQKCDGSSATYILERKPRNKFEFYVCSRNVRMLNEKQQCYHGDNVYWEIAKKYDIENKMKDYLNNNPEMKFVAWQGEICAPNIQKNPHKLTTSHFYAFHMTDSINGRFDIRKAKEIWDEYEIQTVPIVQTGYILPDDFEDFKKEADGYYVPEVCEGNDKCPREGFVYYKESDPNFSFKNVSRKYLLKNDSY